MIAFEFYLMPKHGILLGINVETLTPVSEKTERDYTSVNLGLVFFKFSIIFRN